ncbi:MAG: tetratricopeptide repeat protein [Treponema sp.]|nr:tetratricopeptide repeat protein [Treponema sp.]
MSIPVIILICTFAIIIVTLLVLILKAFIAPQKIEAIPKMLKQGKTQGAIKVAKQIIAKNPKNYKAHYYLGKSYAKDNKSELALMEYKLVNDNAVFGLNLNELEFRKEYTQMLMKHNQNAEALKNYILLTRLEPKNPENYYNCGHLYEENNRYDIALGFMQKTIALDKRHSKAHAEIGLMLYRMKQFNEARKEIDIALKLSPDTYSSYYYLGKIQKDSKDIPAAIKSFEKAQRDPEVKQKAVIEHGACYMLIGRYDNAIIDFQRAIDLDKENLKSETLYAHYFIAACYEKIRKIDKAIEHWEHIYKRNKSFRDVSAKLAEYRDLQANDYLKDYLTCSNEEFTLVCKNATEKGMKFQIMNIEQKKWGCQIQAVERNSESWMSVRKQVIFIRFYREPEPLEEIVIHESLDTMKTLNSVKGYIFSSSGFSNGARRFAENRPVELIDKSNLEKILSAAGSK